MSGTTYPPAVPAAGQLARPYDLTTTVPRELVHRSAVAEVFLTGSARLAEDRFALTGQWPRAHAFFTDDSGPRHDPVIAAETIRQAGLYLAHTAYGIPRGHPFMLRRMDFQAVEDQLRIGTEPTEITIDAVATDVRVRRTSSVLALRFTIHRDDQVVATGGGEFNCVAPAVYRRLRGARAEADVHALPARATPLPPASVGRHFAKDVVLGQEEGRYRWTVSPDPHNAVLFDHGGDHIPGMVLLEAARQAAHRVLSPYGTRPLAASLAFERYAELDSPCVVEAEVRGGPGAGLAVEVTGTQAGETVFTSVLAGSGGLPADPAS